MQTRIRRGLIALAALAALGGAGAAIAGATGNDDESDRPVRGAALERAQAAALAHTGGGHVTETEAGDDEGAYEVEVRRADGSEVEVHLDRGFGVLGSDRDD